MPSGSKTGVAVGAVFAVVVIVLALVIDDASSLRGAMIAAGIVGFLMAAALD